jgi:hypothetical protein
VIVRLVHRGRAPRVALAGGFGGGIPPQPEPSAAGGARRGVFVSGASERACEPSRAHGRARCRRMTSTYYKCNGGSPGGVRVRDVVVHAVERSRGDGAGEIRHGHLLSHAATRGALVSVGRANVCVSWAGERLCQLGRQAGERVAHHRRRVGHTGVPRRTHLRPGGGEVIRGGR